MDLFVSPDLFQSFVAVTWFKFISSLWVPVYKLLWRKRTHADKSGSTQLILVCDSLCSCNLKCETGYIIPISSGGNQTLLRTGLCRIQVPFSAVRSEFWEAFCSSATSHYAKKHKILARLERCPDRLAPFLLSHQNQPKIQQQGVFLPELMQSSSGITVPEVCTGKFLGGILGIINN